MPLTEQDVQSALKDIVDPNTGKDLVATRSAKSVKVSGNDVTVDVELAYPAKTQLEPMKKLVSQKLRSLPGVGAVNVNVTSRIVSHAVQRWNRSSRFRPAVQYDTQSWPPVRRSKSVGVASGIASSRHRPPRPTRSSRAQSRNAPLGDAQ